jgi:tRNA uridine 5-carbamoylmethylation protein Kti12
VTNINIVSGCPGVGKTTIAARLAGELSRGVHVESDIFYHFLTHRILQILPESHAQNETVIRAIARAAGAYFDGGYEVFLDGVFGPWFMPVLSSELGSRPINYIILHAPLTIALIRATSRPEPGREDIVRHMHADFSKSGELDRHRFDTEDLSVEESVKRLRILLVAGKFRLDMTHKGRSENPPFDGDCRT